MCTASPVPWQTLRCALRALRVGGLAAANVLALVTCCALQAAVQMAADWDKAHARVVDALEALGDAAVDAAAAACCCWPWWRR